MEPRRRERRLAELCQDISQQLERCRNLLEAGSSDEEAWDEWRRIVRGLGRAYRLEAAARASEVPVAAVVGSDAAPDSAEGAGRAPDPPPVPEAPWDEEGRLPDEALRRGSLGAEDAEYEQTQT